MKKGCYLQHEAFQWSIIQRSPGMNDRLLKKKDYYFSITTNSTELDTATYLLVKIYLPAGRYLKCSK